MISGQTVVLSPVRGCVENTWWGLRPPAEMILSAICFEYIIYRYKMTQSFLFGFLSLQAAGCQNHRTFVADLLIIPKPGLHI